VRGGNRRWPGGGWADWCGEGVECRRGAATDNRLCRACHNASHRPERPLLPLTDPIALTALIACHVCCLLLPPPPLTDLVPSHRCSCAGTELNSRLETSGGGGGPLPTNRFRPNIVVSGEGVVAGDGAAPFDEDTWRRVRIGEVTFRSVKVRSGQIRSGQIG
jgi:hypothetical protein